MPQVSYPGVYIQEVASGVRTITSVSTSITAFVDFFREGPMNRAVEIYGLSDFARTFGGLDARSEASYAIAQFFLNGGGTALVVRCASGAGAAPLAAASAQVRGNNLAAPELLTLTAASEGAWGNQLRATIDHRTGDPSKFFNLTVSRHASNAKDAPVVTQEKFLGVTRDSTHPRFVEKVLAADSRLARATVTNPGTAGVPAANGTTSGVLPTAQPALQNLLDSLRSVQPPAVPLMPRRLRVQVGGGSVFQATLPTWGAGEVTTLAARPDRADRAGDQQRPPRDHRRRRSGPQPE